MKKELVILTGAGMSAESGIKTFRDANGLWEGYNVMDVATPQGWHRNPKLVLDFYNERRKQLQEVQPNLGHQILAQLEAHFKVQIITQNVDNLHERAGSTNVLHLHGELLKIRSTVHKNYILNWETDLNLGDVDHEGNQLRPHIVWFGEEVPSLEKAITMIEKSDILIIIGTSLQVYPACGLITFAKPAIPIFYIDPNPVAIDNLPNDIKIIAATATQGMKSLQKDLEKYL